MRLPRISLGANRGRPNLEPQPERVPRARRKVEKKNLLAKHIWYLSWGTIGLIGLSQLYERAPDVARKMVSVYIVTWLVGAIGGPVYLSAKANKPPEKPKPPKDVAVTV